LWSQGDQLFNENMLSHFPKKVRKIKALNGSAPDSRLQHFSNLEKATLVAFEHPLFYLPSVFLDMG
jgi:hypothetical protein